MQITLTGVDRYTDLSSLPRDVELNLVYSCTETDNIYWRVAELVKVLPTLVRTHKLSLQIHGSNARTLLINNKLKEIIWAFNRVQIPGKMQQGVKEICDLYPGIEIITQHVYKNEKLLDIENINHSIYMDTLFGFSGGGLRPNYWNIPETHKKIGLVVELTPDVGIKQILELVEYQDKISWIDVNAGVRDSDDKFSVEKAIAFVKECHESDVLRFGNGWTETNGSDIRDSLYPGN